MSPVIDQASSPAVIVMIEDDLGHARLIERNMRRAGVKNEIIPFANGGSALAYLIADGAPTQAIAHRPLLMLLDLNLPDMRGIDILAKVKSTPLLCRCPVVVLTTTDDRSEIERCYALGASVYITKPVNYEAFSTAIRQLGLILALIQVPKAH